jgi:hypothetical protein
LISPPPPFNACRFELQTTPIRSAAPPLLHPSVSRPIAPPGCRNFSSKIRSTGVVNRRFRRAPGISSPLSGPFFLPKSLCTF